MSCPATEVQQTKRTIPRFVFSPPLQGNLALTAVILAALCPTPIRAQEPAGDRSIAEALSAKTCLFVEAANVDILRERWQSTQLGQLWESDSMKPFRDELQQQDQTVEEFLRKNYGLKYESLERHLHQRFAFAAVEVDEQTLSSSFFFQVGDAESEAGRSLLTEAAAELKAHGGKVSETVVPGAAAIYDLPDNEQVVFAFLDDVLLVSGDKAVAADVISHWSEPGPSRLAQLEAYQAVMEQTKSDRAADFIWFADIVRLAAISDEAKGRPADDPRPPFSKRHGFPGMKGVGGQGALGGDPFDQFHRFAIHVPEPREQGFASFEFEAGDVSLSELTPEDASTASVMRVDTKTFFENIGDVYDDITDSEGAYEDTINDVRDNLNVDLVDFAGRLGPRIVTLSRATPEEDRERSLTVVDIKSDKAQSIAADLVKLLLEDNQVSRRRLPGEPNDLWRIRLKAGTDRAFSRGGIMVARGKLWIATHESLIEEILFNRRKLGPLVKEQEFQSQWRDWQPVMGKDLWSLRYARVDRDLQVTYQVLRRDGIDGLDGLENVYGSIILEILNRSEEELKVDFSTLPPFEEIADKLGVSWTSTGHWAEGWFGRIVFRPLTTAADAE